LPLTDAHERVGMGFGLAGAAAGELVRSAVGGQLVRRRWRWFVLLAAIPLAALGYDRLFKVYWVGGADLEVEFLVVDAATGAPIEGAEVAVQSDGGFYEGKERDEAPFALRTDAAGAARRVCRDSMCFGTQSGLRITDTYVVHLPWWTFRVSAPGYEPAGPDFLDMPERVRQVRRAGPRAAKLEVRVPLRRTAAEPAPAPNRADEQ
jgi:hypothetical protein